MSRGAGVLGVTPQTRVTLGPQLVMPFCGEHGHVLLQASDRRFAPMGTVLGP
jgi:hypothetical protein